MILLYIYVYINSFQKLIYGDRDEYIPKRMIIEKSNLYSNISLASHSIKYLKNKCYLFLS